MNKEFIAPKNWGELCSAEPALRHVDWLIDSLPKNDRGSGYAYYSIKSIISASIGWERGYQAEEWPGLEAMAGVRRLSDMPEPYIAKAKTKTERWLRTQEAYDLAMDHVIERLEGPRRSTHAN